MKRRSFLKSGVLALGAPALLRPEELLALPGGVLGQETGGSIRLSSNENALGIPPASKEAILQGLGEANRYPGSSRRGLIAALAEKHGVPTQGIVLGNGSPNVNRHPCSFM